MIPFTSQRKRPRETPQEMPSRVGPYLRYPPFVSLAGVPKARLRSGPPPPGADKEASRLFQSSAPSGAAPERALTLCCYVTMEGG